MSSNIGTIFALNLEMNIPVLDWNILTKSGITTRLKIIKMRKTDYYKYNKSIEEPP